MNILFLSLLDFNTFDERNIYSDLLREFIKNGHNVYCISPVERSSHKETEMLRFGDSCILKIRIGNTQKVKFIEKGISTLLIEPLFIRGIKKYFSNVKFDLVLYATPPVTFADVISFVKKRDGAKSYLMLKDIFPQNSVDLGLLSKKGLKGFVYRYFRSKEKKLYYVSDRIGCMSKVNVEYVLKHNPEIAVDKVEVCPNCIDVQEVCLNEQERQEVRKKYNIPQHKKAFVYGGNLGKPQDVRFLINCIKASEFLSSAYFVIVGSGTDRHFLEKYINESKPANVSLIDQLKHDEYDKLVACCDVGLVFLDHRFTIPNFPSRLLSYMQAGLPVLACTDRSTDIGKVIVDGKFGWWCESDNVQDWLKVLEEALKSDHPEMSDYAKHYLKTNYSTDLAYKIIKDSLV